MFIIITQIPRLKFCTRLIWSAWAQYEGLCGIAAILFRHGLLWQSAITQRICRENPFAMDALLSSGWLLHTSKQNGQRSDQLPITNSGLFSGIWFFYVMAAMRMQTGLDLADGQKSTDFYSERINVLLTSWSTSIYHVANLCMFLAMLRTLDQLFAKSRNSMIPS